MNDEEKDVYIRTKIKDEHIPEKIDNLFNNSIKIIESKGEEQMEENLDMNQNNQNNQNNQSNQNNKEKKKMPAMVKAILAGAACVTVLLGGGNIYATSQGYDNIFFLIKHIVTGVDVRGKENILSDRDITISYRPIEISKGTQIQINSLVIKDNEAKLKLQVNETNVEKPITPLVYVVKDENKNELYSNLQDKPEISDNTSKEYKEELTLKGFKEDTKKLLLEIFKNDATSIVTLEIDLENREINVVGNQEEFKKISEEELKQYLGAFANMGMKWPTTIQQKEPESFNNEKIISTAIALGHKNNTLKMYTIKDNNMERNAYKIDDIYKIAKEFTDIQLNDEGQLDIGANMQGYDPKDGLYYKVAEDNNIKYYTYVEITSGAIPTYECIYVDDINYINGIYNVTFTFYDHNQLQFELEGATDEEIKEKLQLYQMSIGLILDENNAYSKYRVSSMSDVTLVGHDKLDSDSVEENNTSDKEAFDTIQGFLNIICSKGASTIYVLQTEEIGLLKNYEEWNQMYNNNERDSEGYVKTNIRYTDFKSSMLQYMSPTLFDEHTLAYKNVNDILWVQELGGSGSVSKVESIKTLSLYKDIITYEVVMKEFGPGDDIGNYRTEKFELQKNENGKYVVSAWGWQIEKRERENEAFNTIQGFLNIYSTHEYDTLGVLAIDEIGFKKEYNEIHNSWNTAEKDSEGYKKTSIKYEDFKNKMLQYMSEELFVVYSFGYKNIDGILWVREFGASGFKMEVKNIITIASSENTSTYKVEYILNLPADGKENAQDMFELQKNKNGKFVVSDWGWKTNEEKILQDYLNLTGCETEFASIDMLEKLNLVDEVKLTSKDDEALTNVETNIEYAAFKQKMLTYVTEEFFEKEFGKNYYQQKNGNLLCCNFGLHGGSGIIATVGSVTLKSGNTYVANVKYIASSQDGSVEYKTIEFSVEKVEGRPVISYCDKII